MGRCTLIVCVMVAVAGSAQAWSPESNLTAQFASAAGSPAMAFDAAGRLHVVYSAQASGGQLRLYYQYLLGGTWSAPAILPAPDRKITGPDLAVDSLGRLHVVASYRIDGTTNTPYTVHYWSFDGTVWTGPIMLSSGQGGDNDSATAARIAVDRLDNLHVIWSNDGERGGEGDILYRKKLNGSWLPTYNITNNNPGTSYGSVNPDLAVDRLGDNVHVVWHDDFLNNGFQAYYTRNSNLGDTAAWLPSGQWFQLSTGDYGKAPKIILDRDNNPNVFWIDRLGGSTNVAAYRRWTGTQWTPPANWGSTFIQAGVFDSANVLHFVYTAIDGTTGATELYYRMYDYISFSPDEYVSTGANTLKVDAANLVLDGYGVPHVGWQERKGEWPGTGYIFHAARSTYSGPTGLIAGTVRDQYGQPIPAATVGGLAGFSTLSAADGTYSTPVPVGSISVTAAKDFYVPQTIPNVPVVEDQTTTLDFTITAIHPGPPALLATNPANTSNLIGWMHSASGNATGTMIRVKTTGFPADPDDGTLVVDRAGAPGSSDTFNHAGLTNGTTYYYAAFAHDADGHYSSPATTTGIPYGPGDADRDGDVDLADFGPFQVCLSGSAVHQSEPGCAWARLDADLDVDADDLTLFLGCLSGSGIPADPSCAD